MTNSLSIPMDIPTDGIAFLENIPINSSYLPPDAIDPTYDSLVRTASYMTPV
jgi:hypothetical protein